MIEKAQAYAALMSEKGVPAVKTRISRETETEDPEEDFFRLINHKAETMVSTDMSAWGRVDSRLALEALKKSDQGHLIQTITLHDGEDRARVITMAIGPSMLIQIGETLEETDEYLDVFRNLLTILIIILILVSSVIGWFLARKALIDMAAVTQTAEDITRGAYHRRVRIKGQYQEVQRLGATFNTMLDRIQILIQSMQQINDNIAHDLRSPLARIRGIAEMTIVKDKSIGDYKEMAVSTIEECDTLIDMINTMLDITEIEAGVNEAKVEEFELSSLVLEACELFRPMANEKKVGLQSNLPTSLPLKGDRKRMQRIVTNIIENAIKYTPDHGTVVVTAQRDDGTIKIEVEDTGSGISKTDLPHIFERFYRCDQSRTQGGVGLGLSLVKAYMESMKGAIDVQSIPNQGSIFTLRFDAG